MKKTRHSQRYKRLLRELKAARLRAGLTQTQVAQRLNAHAPFVSKCESGERRIDAIELLDFCRIYRISLAELLNAADVN
jgi:transcriptional regulator with XRE-family HTH domain